MSIRIGLRSQPHVLVKLGTVTEISQFSPPSLRLTVRQSARPKLVLPILKLGDTLLVARVLRARGCRCRDDLLWGRASALRAAFPGGALNDPDLVMSGAEARLAARKGCPTYYFAAGGFFRLL